MLLFQTPVMANISIWELYSRLNIMVPIAQLCWAVSNLLWVIG